VTPVQAVAAAVEGTERPRVAVLGRHAQRRVADQLAAALPAAEVLVMRARDPSLERTHLWLTASGPFDAVVDQADADVEERLARFLFHARPGGRYVVRAGGEPEHLSRVATWVRGLEQRRDDGAAPPRTGDARPPDERDLDALAWSIQDAETSDDHVVVRHRARTVATVRDRQVNRLLDLRGDSDDLLASLPAATLRSRSTVRTNEGAAARLLPPEFEAPGLHVRRWAGVECHPRQMAVHREVLLPASLAGRTQGRLGHPFLASWAPGFVTPPPGDDFEELPGAWFYLDNLKQGHFGHAMTEQLSMTWGWAPAVRAHPELGALVCGKPGSTLADWELHLLESAGIPRDRVRLVTRPVRVETLLTATAMYSRPDYIHPEIVATYDTVGSTLAGQSSDRDWPARVFLTRQPGKRGCDNATEVEDLHRAHGFEVVRPETLPLPDQARMVREAEVISGFAGSGMFHTALTGGPRHVIAITHENYHVHNEQLIAAVLGHRLDLVLARPDVPRGDHFDRDSFHSAYTIDFAREGAFLRDVLAGLGGA
jgi:hypothetical protein